MKEEKLHSSGDFINPSVLLSTLVLVKPYPQTTSLNLLSEIYGSEV
jgi:hypothetical protein